jgi:hypothetical protein
LRARGTLPPEPPSFASNRRDSTHSRCATTEEEEEEGVVHPAASSSEPAFIFGQSALTADLLVADERRFEIGPNRKLVRAAIRSNAQALLRTYKERGIDSLACWPEADRTDMSIVLAANLGHIEAIRTLYRLGADVNTPDSNGYTSVFAAACCGHVQTIHALCELGADVNTPDNKDGVGSCWPRSRRGYSCALRARG